MTTELQKPVADALQGVTAVGSGDLLGCVMVILIICLAVEIRMIFVLHQDISKQKKANRKRRQDISNDKQVLRARFESLCGSGGTLGVENLDGGSTKCKLGWMRLKCDKMKKCLNLAWLRLLKNPCTHFLGVVSTLKFFRCRSHKSKDVSKQPNEKS